MTTSVNSRLNQLDPEQRKEVINTLSTEQLNDLSWKKYKVEQGLYAADTFPAPGDSTMKEVKAAAYRNSDAGFRPYDFTYSEEDKKAVENY